MNIKNSSVYEFSERLYVEPDQIPLKDQLSHYSRQREYLIPTMNRRQVIFFTFINSANTQNQPSIWLDILHKSVQLKFQTARNKVFGVSQQRASLMGLCVSLIIVIAIIVIVGSIWLAASISFLVGLFAQFFGVLAIKLWNQLKQFISG